MSKPTSGFAFRWTGSDSEGAEWTLEIEADAFNEVDGLVVSIYAEDSGHSDDGKRVSAETIVTASPEQARKMASALVRVADHVEQRRGEGHA